jgi:hypothetical protein
MCVVHDAALARFMTTLDSMDEWAVEPRYPSIEKSLTLNQVTAALEQITELYREIFSRLPEAIP